MLQRMTRRIRRRANLVLAALTCVAFLGGAAQRGLFAQNCWECDPSNDSCGGTIVSCTASSSTPSLACVPNKCSPTCLNDIYQTYCCTSATCTDADTSTYTEYINCVSC